MFSEKQESTAKIPQPEKEAKIRSNIALAIVLATVAIGSLLVKPTTVHAQEPVGEDGKWHGTCERKDGQGTFEVEDTPQAAFGGDILRWIAEACEARGGVAIQQNPENPLEIHLTVKYSILNDAPRIDANSSAEEIRIALRSVFDMTSETIKKYSTSTITFEEIPPDQNPDITIEFGDSPSPLSINPNFHGCSSSQDWGYVLPPDPTSYYYVDALGYSNVNASRVILNDLCIFAANSNGGVNSRNAKAVLLHEVYAHILRLRYHKNATTFDPNWGHMGGWTVANRNLKAAHYVAGGGIWPVKDREAIVAYWGTKPK